MTKKTISVREIDMDTWRKFRAQCVERDLTVSQGLNHLLRQIIEKKEG